MFRYENLGMLSAEKVYQNLVENKNKTCNFYFCSNLCELTAKRVILHGVIGSTLYFLSAGKLQYLEI